MAVFSASKHRRTFLFSERQQLMPKTQPRSNDGSVSTDMHPFGQHRCRAINGVCQCAYVRSAAPMWCSQSSVPLCLCPFRQHRCGAVIAVCLCASVHSGSIDTFSVASVGHRLAGSLPRLLFIVFFPVPLFVREKSK